MAYMRKLNISAKTYNKEANLKVDRYVSLIPSADQYI